MKLVLLLAGVCACFAQTPADRPVSRTDANSLLAHEQLLDKAKHGGVDIYFEGDSITRRWGATDYPQLLANWNENFFGWNAADFGWGADTVQNILWRLDNGELDGVNPKVMVLLAGTNNVGRNTPAPGTEDAKAADITRGLQKVIETMRVKAPDATLIVTAIFPRNDNMAVMPVIDRINANLARLAGTGPARPSSGSGASTGLPAPGSVVPASSSRADGKKVRYLNINDKLADAKGSLYPGMMNADKLHPAIKGYQVWADALKPIFTDLLGPPAKTDHAPPATGDPSAKK